MDYRFNTSTISASDLDASKNQILGSVSSLLEDQEYSDLKITCQGREFNVHKSVICTQSRFFRNACKKAAFEEGMTNMIDLPLDDPDTVTAMIRFLYTAKWKPDEPAWLLGAQTYTLADKYEIDTLKRVVYSYHLARFDNGMGGQEWEGFSLAVQWVYNNTTKDDRIRDIFILTIAERLEYALDDKDGPVPKLMTELPELSLDVLRAIRFGCRNVQSPSFYTPLNGLDTKEPRTYKCTDCYTIWKLEEDLLLQGVGSSPNCPSCGTMMDKLEHDCTMLYRWDCVKCSRSSLCEHAHEDGEGEDWTCCYCGAQEGFRESK